MSIFSKRSVNTRERECSGIKLQPSLIGDAWGSDGKSQSFLLTNSMIVLNVAAYAGLLLLGERSFLLLGQVGELVFGSGFYWQLFTSLFVHFNILHLLSNCYGLFYFGRLIQTRYSTFGFLAIYFGSGLLGNIMSLYLLPPTVVSGGASGAIFGLVGAYVVTERKTRHLGSAVVYAALIFIQSSGFGVNIFAHLFGLVGGLALGLLLGRTRPSYPSYWSL